MRQAGDLLAAVNGLRDEIRAVARRVDDRGESVTVDFSERMNAGFVKDRALETIESQGAKGISPSALAQRLGVPTPTLEAALKRNLESRDIYLMNGNYTVIPF